MLGYSDAIPESLGKLTNMTTLNLEWNQLSGELCPDRP